MLIMISWIWKSFCHTSEVWVKYSRRIIWGGCLYCYVLIVADDGSKEKWEQKQAHFIVCFIYSSEKVVLPVSDCGTPMWILRAKILREIFSKNNNNKRNLT